MYLQTREDNLGFIDIAAIMAGITTVLPGILAVAGQVLPFVVENLPKVMELAKNILGPTSAAALTEEQQRLLTNLESPYLEQCMQELAAASNKSQQFPVIYAKWFSKQQEDKNKKAFLAKLPYIIGGVTIAGLLIMIMKRR